jgi:hypothetical protein
MTYKLFESGETLTANDVQTYFMDQVVIHVATEADLADLIADHENVRVAYAQDTDKVYALVSGSWEALAYEGGDFTFDDLTVTGNLTVTGTTTTVDSTTIQVKDKFVFEGATADAYETTLQVAEPTADRTITLPDATGTVALTSQISGMVTESGTQTLTNKSVSLANNTVTGTTAEFNTALTDGDFATLAGTETLTNKTISGASNTLSNIPNNALSNSSITIDGSSVALGGTATIIPSQTGNSGKYLTTNGTTASWGTVDLSSKTDKSTLTTTGDIYYASSANTPARLGIGSTGQVLTVSSGLPSWATPSGGFTQLVAPTNFGNVSSVTISNLSQSYRDLRVVIKRASFVSGGSVRIALNNTTSSYGGGHTDFTGTVTTTRTNSGNAFFSIGRGTYTTSASNYVIDIPEYTSIHNKWGRFIVTDTDDGSNADAGSWGWFIARVGAVSSIILSGSNNFDEGTYEVWGIK